jgi:hypothetical protein
MAVFTPNTSMDELDLRFRVYNALYRNGIRTVGEVLRLSDEQFLRMRNVGIGSLRDLDQCLTAHGLQRRNDATGGDSPLSEVPPPGLDRARWLGEQIGLDVDRHPSLYSSELSKRRESFLRVFWALDGAESKVYEGRTSRWYVKPLPGGVSLHLEALARLADEELGEGPID